MNVHSMLFNTAMVKALLRGDKTQTRRIMKPQPFDVDNSDGVALLSESDSEESKIIGQAPFIPPFGNEGDLIWVRETFQGPLFNLELESQYLENKSLFETPEYCAYAATDPKPDFYDVDSEEMVCRWRPSIHMPRWASRLTLRITDVHIEHLQDISEQDAIAEGCNNAKSEAAEAIGWYEKPCSAFRRVWESTGGDWDANPWVWVYQFEVILANVDTVIKEAA